MDNLLMILLGFVIVYMFLNMCGKRVEGLECGFPGLWSGSVSCTGYSCNSNDQCKDKVPWNDDICVGFNGGSWSGTCT